MTALPLRIIRARARRRRLALSRRRALQGLGVMFGAVVSGCKDEPNAEAEAGETGDGDGDGDGTSGDGDGDGDGDGTPGDGDGDGAPEPPYEVCESSNLTPAELLANIDHIVVVMMENRSFDHMFGALSLVEGLPIDGLTGSEQNPDLDANPVAVFNTDKYVHDEDPPHSWTASHAQFNGGAQDGFVTEHQNRGAQEFAEVMGYYQRDQVPVYHALADEYMLCDRWFCSVMGPTWPNRFHLHCGQSDGMQTNDPISGVTSIFDQLADAGISHRYYYANLPFVITYGTPGDAEHLAPLGEFFTDAENGQLPAFSIIDPILTAGPIIGNDDHPPADIRDGQMFVSSIYDAMASSPNWDRSLLVIIYDEHGGFYDHVPPPQTVDTHPGFEQLGFRIPALVMGGQVRRRCVNGTVFDHVSIAATVAARWGLTPLNERVAATADLSSCIDPELIDNPRPPAALPRITISRTAKVHVPGAEHGGQDELLALFCKGNPDAQRAFVQDSVEHAALLRERALRRGLVRVKD